MKLGEFIVGLSVGAVVGMLVAPKKGSELREDLKTKSTEIYDKVKDMSKEDFMALVNTTVDDARRAIDEFDGESFKDATLTKFNEQKAKLEELYTSVSSKEEFVAMKDKIKSMSDEVSAKIEEVTSKIKDKENDAIDAVEEVVEEVAEESTVILEDLKD